MINFPKIKLLSILFFVIYIFILASPLMIVDNNVFSLGVISAQETTVNAGSGFFSPVTDILVNFVADAFLNIAHRIYALASVFAFIGGFFLNMAVFFSISKASIIIPIDKVNEVWVVLRDIANVGLIFALIYAAIQTIIGNSTSTIKKTILNVIIVAITINFSLFATKAIIDVSNVLALSIYNQTIEQKNTDFGSTGASASLGDLIETVASKVSGKGFIGLAGKYIEALAVPGAVINPSGIKNSATDVGINGLTSVMSFVVIIFNSFVILFAGIMMSVTSLLFYLRFGVSVYLMIFAPLALLAIVLPQLNSIKESWLKFMKAVFMFPPVFFLFTYISLKIITAMKLSAVTGTSGLIGITDSTIAIVGQSLGKTGLAIAINGFFLGVPIIAATAFSFFGSTAIVNAYKGATNRIKGYAFAKTVGRGGSIVADRLDKSRLGNTLIGRDITKSLRSITSESKQTGGRSYKEYTEEDKKSASIKAKRDKRITYEKNLAKIAEAQKIKDRGYAGTEGMSAIELDNRTQELYRANAIINDKTLTRSIADYQNNLTVADLKGMADDIRKNKDGIGDNLTDSQLSALSKDPETESLVKDIYERRLSDLSKELSNPDSTADGVEEITNNLSNQTIFNMSVDNKIKLAEKIGDRLSGDQYKELTKDMQPADKVAFDTARTNRFVQMASTEGEKITAERFKDITKNMDNTNKQRFTSARDTYLIANPNKIREMSADDVASLSDDVLMNPDIIEQMNPGTVDKLSKRSSRLTSAIRSQIISNSGHPAYEYITRGVGKGLF